MTKICSLDHNPSRIHYIPLLERGFAVSREAQVLVPSVHTAGVLGDVLVRSGRVAEGFDLLRWTQEAREPLGTGLYLSRFLVELRDAYIATGRLEDARASGTKALALMRERGLRGHETHALRLLGEIASRQDPRHRDGGGALS